MTSPPIRFLMRSCRPRPMAKRCRAESRQKRILRRGDNLACHKQCAEPDHDPERRLNLAKQKPKPNIVACEPVQEAIHPPEEHPGGGDHNNCEQDLADRKLSHYGRSGCPCVDLVHVRFTRRNRSFANRCASGRTRSPGCSGSDSINPRAESRSNRLSTGLDASRKLLLPLPVA